VNGILRADCGDRLCQGDILRNVDLPEYSSVEGGDAVLTVIRFPLALVLSQDCDLRQDYGARVLGDSNSMLLSVLMVPLYEMSDAASGEQLSELGVKMPSLPSGGKSQSAKDLRQNKNVRYHCLPLNHASEDLPPVVADFKNYFAVSASYLTCVRERLLVCSLAELYREDVVQRFAAYLSRIGLPVSIQA